MLCVFALGFQRNTVLPSVASFNLECTVACVLTQHLICMILLSEVFYIFSDMKKSENQKEKNVYMENSCHEVLMKRTP